MRIPKRAKLIKEKKGHNNVRQFCRVQVWEDWKDGTQRFFFSAYKEDWKRIFVKVFSGKNINNWQEWWDDNASMITED